MARDSGLEELVREHLGDRPGLSGKAMFGSWCWLLQGKLLCGANHEGVLVRLGKGNVQWALDLDGIVLFTSGTRPMAGWVLVAPETFADDALARRLIDGALAFVEGLPPKETHAAARPTRAQRPVRIASVPGASSGEHSGRAPDPRPTLAPPPQR